ncbi:MAG: alpha/beta hydrolase [Pseudomonadota bacterium]
MRQLCRYLDRARGLLAVLAALTVFVGFITPANAASANAARSSFEKVDCWNSKGVETASICGYLDVPEDWEEPGDRRIHLPVALFQAKNKKENAVPVIFLTGGPGVSTNIDKKNRREGWRRFADLDVPGHDLIVFDQRGAPLSQPALNCPNAHLPEHWAAVSNNPESFDDALQREKTDLTACYEQLLEEGHDLAAYTSRQSAQDLATLILLLGYDRAILVGVSYGTHLALTTMDLFPEQVEAAVLDSVLHAADAQRDYFDQSHAAFERLLDACRDHDRCHQAYPNLERDFVDLLDRLENEPVVLEIWNAQGHEPLYALLDRNVLLEVLFHALYRNQPITKLPWTIDGLAKGEDRRIIPLLEDYLYNSFATYAAFGLSLSVWCREIYFHDPKPLPANSSDLAFHIYSWSEHFKTKGVCTYWPTGQLEPIEAKAVASEIPVLLLSGAFDPVTPIEYGDAVARHLPNSHHFVFPATGHGQIGSDRCARQTMSDFVADPSKRPAPACLDDLRQPAFLSLGGG